MVRHRVQVFLVVLLAFGLIDPVSAQVGAGVMVPSQFGIAPATNSRSQLPDAKPLSIAEAEEGSAETVPIDLTPVNLPERGNALDSFKAQTLYHLPARLFLYANCENTLRLETNVLQTLKRNRADMIYRVLPNITLGWAFTPRTRFAWNYFFLRDTYTKDYFLDRNMQSVGFRLDHDIPVGEKATLTTGIFTRELFITHSGPLNDLIPSVVLTRRVGFHGVVYGSILGQFRFRNVLQRYQEMDQFYSVGGAYRKGLWYLSGDFTTITNFGKRRLRGGHNNQNFILTLEAGRQMGRRLPVTAFIRLEPIFNTGANSSTGFAGVNIRVFGGLRVEVAKPAIFPVSFDK